MIDGPTRVASDSRLVFFFCGRLSSSSLFLSGSLVLSCSLTVLFVLLDPAHPLLDCLLVDIVCHFWPPFSAIPSHHHHHAHFSPVAGSHSLPATTTATPVCVAAMAIDSEKRARGLRVPSLASIKAFSKKNDPLQQHQQQQQQQQAIFDAEKNLPSPPGFDSISPSSAMPAKRAPQTFGFDAVPMMDFETSRYPMPGPGPAQASAASPGGASAGAGLSPGGAGTGASPMSRSAASPVSGPLSAPQPVQRAPMPHPQPQLSHSRSPSTGSPADSDPLEDYIPDPSPERDEMMYQAGATGPDGPVPNGNGDVSDEPEPVAEKDDWEPPMAEVAAPLNKLHFNCYQEHRSMPSAANVWHSVPCMTCNKVDREVRHRCVFCCLRICEGCYGALQKCSRRSLDELLTLVR